MKRAAVAAVLASFLFVMVWSGHQLLYTAAGARWMLEQVAGAQVAGVRGRLAGQLDLRGLRWRNGVNLVSVGHASLDWSPWALLRGQVRILSLRLSNVRVDLAPETRIPPAPEFAFPPPPGWLRLLRGRIGRLHIADLDWQRGHGQFALPRIDGDLEWTGRRLRSRHLLLASAHWTAEGSLDFGWVAHSLESTGTWTSAGTRARWRIDWRAQPGAVFGGPMVVRVRGRKAFTISADARVEAHALQVRNARVWLPWQTSAASVSAVFSMDGPSSSPYRLDLHADGIYPGGFRRLLPAGPYGFNLDLYGTFRSYRGRLDFKMRSAAGGRLAGEVAGNLSGLRIRALSGHLLGARVTESRLAIAWHSRPGVTARLRFSALNPQVLYPHLRGALNGVLALHLTEQDRGAAGELVVRLGPSRIGRQPLSGQARLRFAPQHVRVDVLEIAGPGLALRAAGVLERRIGFSARVSHWSAVHPGVNGESRVSGWFAYAGGRWRASIRGSADHLRIGSFRLAHATLSVVPGPDSKVGLRLNAQKVRAAGQEFDLTADASGTPRHFDSHLRFVWPHEFVRLSAVMSRQNGAWQAVLQGLDVHGLRSGRWRLSAPVRIVWAHGRMTVPSTAFSGGQRGSVRLRCQWSPAQRTGDGSLHVRALPIDLRSAAGDLRVKGYLDLDLGIRCSRGCTAHANASLADTVIAWRQPEQMIRVAVSRLDVRLSAVPGRLILQGHMRLANGHGSGDARLVLPVTLGFPISRSMSGPVQGRFEFNAGGIRPVATAIHGVRVGPGWGIRGSLRLTGTWARPVWNGSADLRNAALFIPRAGIAVSGISAKLLAEGSRIQISSFRAQSGKGSIHGHGTVSLSAPDRFRLRLQVTGRDFTILNLPEITASVAPEITVDGNARHVTITGTVTADHLRILGSQIGGVRPSRDVVFEKAPASSVPGPALDADLRIVLGNDARVVMGGLQSGLTGTLEARVRDSAAPQVEGVLHMTDGSYRIYGESLRFADGVIRFHGPPELAALDVLALRHIAGSGPGINQRSVQAGVRVSGTLRSPQVRLYSVPAMSDTDVLSYLIFGYPASGLQSQNTLLAAAAGQLFSATQASLFRKNLLGDVGFVSPPAGSAEGTSTSSGPSGLAGTMVTLGHYLTPSLYISIGQSIFGPGAVARLRYRLTRSIELRTEGGTTGNGVSVYYQIDLP